MSGIAPVEGELAGLVTDELPITVTHSLRATAYAAHGQGDVAVPCVVAIESATTSVIKAVNERMTGALALLNRLNEQ